MGTALQLQPRQPPPPPFTPASQVQATFSCKLDWGVVPTKKEKKKYDQKNIQRPKALNHLQRVRSSFLLSAFSPFFFFFWKRHHFIMGLCRRVWQRVPRIFHHMEGKPIVCSAASLQGFAMPLSGHGLVAGGRIPCSLIKIASSCPLSQLHWATTPYTHTRMHARTHSTSDATLDFFRWLSRSSLTKFNGFWLIFYHGLHATEKFSKCAVME